MQVSHYKVEHLHFGLIYMLSSGHTAMRTHLGECAATDKVGVVCLSQVHRPWTYCSDMKAQVLLVGCRSQREGMVFAVTLGKASNTHPLAWLILEVLRALELDVRDICYEIISIDLITQYIFQTCQSHARLFICYIRYIHLLVCSV